MLNMITSGESSAKKDKREVRISDTSPFRQGKSITLGALI